MTLDPIAWARARDCAVRSAATLDDLIGDPDGHGAGPWGRKATAIAQLRTALLLLSREDGDSPRSPAAPDLGPH